MKKTDMELKAIREKLRLLESEPPAGDVISAPWSTPMSASSTHRQPTHRHPTEQSASRPAYFENAAYTPKSYSAGPSSKNASPQAAAIEALKKRSTNQVSGVLSDHRVDDLIAQEIYRLEVHAQNINERSQQQAAELLAMKRSAQQAALALRRQGIHDHPQLKIISELLATHASTTVPQVKRNSQGYFSLSQNPVNLHRAEQEALSNAEALRSRTPFHSLKETDDSQRATSAQFVPFTEDIKDGPALEEYIDDYELETPRLSKGEGRSSRRRTRGLLASLRHFVLKQMAKRKQRLQRQGHSNCLFAAGVGSPRAAVSANDRFSWLDGTIWFSAAAITRIVLEALVLSYPPLRTPLMLMLFSAISFSIYRVVVSQSSSWTATYRLGIVLLGLFLGGSLS